MSNESSFEGETNLSGFIGDINSNHGHKGINKLAYFNICWVFPYIIPVIIFAAAVKTGLFSIDGTLLVDKYKQTTIGGQVNAKR